MYNFASKILSAFLDPLAILAFLLVFALLVRRKRPRLFEIVYTAAILFILVLGCPAVSRRLERSLENQYPDRGVAAYPVVQAIVALGGAIHMPSELHHSSGIVGPSDRLLTAFRLYRAGKAPLILLSGGNGSLTGKAPGPPEASYMELLLEEWGIPASAILAEGGSINTHENALFSYQLLAPRGIKRIILVTSAQHMPRAAAAFRKAGFDVIASPADFQTGWGELSTIFRWIPAAAALVSSDGALHEWLGLWVYRLRGWA